MPNTNVCQTCRYFNNRVPIRPQFSAPGVTVTIPAGGGFCTFNAPAVSASGLPWPVTTPQSGCGQWAAAS